MALPLEADHQEVISLDSPARHSRRLVGPQLCHNNLQLIGQLTEPKQRSIRTFINGRCGSFSELL